MATNPFELAKAASKGTEVFQLEGTITDASWAVKQQEDGTVKETGQIMFHVKDSEGSTYPMFAWPNQFPGGVKPEIPLEGLKCRVTASTRKWVNPATGEEQEVMRIHNVVTDIKSLSVGELVLMTGKVVSVNM